MNGTRARTKVIRNRKRSRTYLSFSGYLDRYVTFDNKIIVRVNSSDVLLMSMKTTSC
jgi:hypothetical protein